MIDLIPHGNIVNTMDKVIVDGANGVGGEKLVVIKKVLQFLDLEIRNSGKEGVLNEEVGADYVQKEKVVPRGFAPADAGTR